ncbi:MAG TPA: hypothetical protein VGM77_04480 [Gemmatimonadales bacterium]|jgi:hypothetical protein
MRLASAALVLAALFAAGCANDDIFDGSSTLTDKCKTDVTGVSSPTTGAITLAGQFYASESVIIRDGTTQIASGTPATDRTAFTFTSVPSGTHSWEILISCDAGQDDLGMTTFVVK